mgnify:FL=1
MIDNQAQLGKLDGVIIARHLKVLDGNTMLQRDAKEGWVDWGKVYSGREDSREYRFNLAMRTLFARVWNTEVVWNRADLGDDYEYMVISRYNSDLSRALPVGGGLRKMPKDATVATLSEIPFLALLDEAFSMYFDELSKYAEMRDRVINAAQQ